jgi:hypothetical protein
MVQFQAEMRALLVRDLGAATVPNPFSEPLGGAPTVALFTG